MTGKTIRLDRLLGNLGYGSRREIDALARAGRIMLAGEPVVRGDARIPAGRDLPERLLVNGEPVDPPQGIVLMLHKPIGVTCSRKEDGPLVYGLLPARWRRRDPAISTVGRLDKETSGLLLMTDDGDILHRIISPKHHVPKRYRVHLARPLRGDEAAILSAGGLMLEGEDKPLLPASLEVLSATEVHLTISEGRYHQVRRMFAAVGNHVDALHRDRIGELGLPDDLRPGTFRVLADTEVDRVLPPR